jgi:hypothetical protein
MKLRTCLLLIVISLCVACKKDATNPTTALSGKWNNVGQYISAGGPEYFQPSATVGTTTFSNNGTLQSSIFTKYNKYIVTDASTVALMGNSGLQENYTYTIKGDTLLMSSKLNLCIEGCAIVLVNAKP